MSYINNKFIRVGNCVGLESQTIEDAPIILRESTAHPYKTGDRIVALWNEFQGIPTEEIAGIRERTANLLKAIEPFELLAEAVLDASQKGPIFQFNNAIITTENLQELLRAIHNTGK